MKFSQLTEYNKTIFFFKTQSENESVRLVPEHFLLSENALYDVKSGYLQPSFNIIREPSTWHTIKTNSLTI